MRNSVFTLLCLNLLISYSKSYSDEHDCAIFWLGSDGYLSGSMTSLARSYRRANANARVEIRRYYESKLVSRSCINPLLVGYSMGALSAIAAGNKINRGRVITIDPPRFGYRYSARPTVNFYLRFGFLGGGRVSGNAMNHDLTNAGVNHLTIPGSRVVCAEVLRQFATNTSRTPTSSTNRGGYEEDVEEILRILGELK